MSNKKLTAFACVCSVAVLLGYLISYGIGVSEAYDLKAENEILRTEVQELSDHDAELRGKLVTLSNEYHALYDEIHGGEAWHDAGEFVITHYCPCIDCCGKCDAITYTGVVATMGRTVSVDPDVIPLGSEVLINGVVYIAEDTGVHGRVIDVYIASHEQALAMGVYRTGVSYR